MDACDFEPSGDQRDTCVAWLLVPTTEPRKESRYVGKRGFMLPQSSPFYPLGEVGGYLYP